MNAISIDLEDWWCNEYLLPYLKDEADLRSVDRVIESVEPIMDLFDRTKTLATFFVLGSTAVRYPELIREINDRGHEIACHGFSHKPLYKLSATEFQEELDACNEVIGRYSPKGFRAPSFSLNNSSKYAIGILKKNGFEYDSSIYPTWTPLYQCFKAPKTLYRISSADVEMIDANSDMVEVPLTVTTTPLFGFPCAGGFFLRLIPEKLLLRELLKVQRSRPAIIYIHPWETNLNIPKVNAGFFANIEANYSKDSVMRKLSTLLNNMEFCPIIDLVKEYRKNVG